VKARYRLIVKSYFVAGLIKAALGSHPIAMSATIGNVDIFSMETGLRGLRYVQLPSTFPVNQTRLFVPKDALDLSQKGGEDQQRKRLNQTLRKIIAAAAQFAKAGKRSLVVVISEDERAKLLKFAAETNKALRVVTYDDQRSARQVALAFAQGEGDVLLGTASQFAEGVDLPRQTAPVIFFLRPGYAPPNDPQSVFEERRFGEGRVWALRHWRVTIQAMQVRGRNVRTAEDLGVCFFMDSRFTRFLYGALPDWLRPAYASEFTMEAGIQETLRLLDEKGL
jgi:Rad3-related DNA helicase